jgi:hypothetical protein
VVVVGLLFLLLQGVVQRIWGWRLVVLVMVMVQLLLHPS